MLSNKDQQLVRKHQTLLPAQAHLRQADIEKVNLLNVVEMQHRTIAVLEAQLA